MLRLRFGSIVSEWLVKAGDACSRARDSSPGRLGDQVARRLTLLKVTVVGSLLLRGVDDKPSWSTARFQAFTYWLFGSGSRTRSAFVRLDPRSNRPSRWEMLDERAREFRSSWLTSSR
jgi:hypothetical protein